jgi:hypothetical protein
MEPDYIPTRFLAPHRLFKNSSTDSEPTKLLYHPKQNPRRGVGLSQINTTCLHVPLLVNFKESRHLGLESFSYFVHENISLHDIMHLFIVASLGTTNYKCSSVQPEKGDPTDVHRRRGAP